jgi:hypothetical protein
VSAQEQGWRGIVPLHSTRSDVERLLGKPMKGYSDLYDTEKERIIFNYQGQPCVASDSQSRPERDGWNVPYDTVLSFTVNLKTKVLLSDIGIDKSKYKEARYPYGPDIIYYNNDDDGRSYAVEGRDGTVRSISFYWTPKDEYLRCK